MINNSNTHYCDEFVSKCTLFFLQGFDTIYNNTLQKCRKYRFLLKQFQEDLEKIHLWNALIIDNEHKRFMISGNCDWLDNLIKACFLELSEQFVRTHNVSYDLSNVVLPPGNVFIHKCYINIARALWKQPQLLFHDFTAVEKLRNREVFTSIIQKTIIDTFKTNLPMENMIDVFLDQDGGGSSNELYVNTPVTTTETHSTNKNTFENQNAIKEDRYQNSSITENNFEDENAINEVNFEDENAINEENLEDETVFDDQTDDQISDEVTPLRNHVDSEQITSTHVLSPKNELFDDDLKREQLSEMSSKKSDSECEQQLNDQDVNEECDQYETNIENGVNNSYDSISEEIKIVEKNEEETSQYQSHDDVVDQNDELSNHNDGYYEETDLNMISTDTLPSYNIEKDESMNMDSCEQSAIELENVRGEVGNTNEIVLSVNGSEPTFQTFQTNNDEPDYTTEETLFEIKDITTTNNDNDASPISNNHSNKEIKSINIYDKRQSNREKISNLLGTDVRYKDFKYNKNKLKKYLLLQT